MFVIAAAFSPVLAADDPTPPLPPVARTIAPPSKLTAADHPDDVGNAIDLKWELSPDDRKDADPRVVTGYRVSRAPAGSVEFEFIKEVPYGTNDYTDQKCTPGAEYLYEVVAFREHEPEILQSAPARLSKPVRTIRQWFIRARAGFFAILLIVCGAVILFTEMVRAGRKLHVREIAGLKAIEEAVGRATEMGRPCLFVPGFQDMNEITTVAGVTVLSHVAKIAAEYDATIQVPTAKSMVMTAAQETVRAAYLSAGRPEAYNDDRVYYVTDEQFAYVAHLTGYMVREKPAACFYAGIFYAESLILAETGNSIGAIQIAGTSETSQLPFFVAACDYTLIGEELFAASAYLSGEPHQMGSLKGQDTGKVLAASLLLAGCLLASLVQMFPGWDAPGRALNVLTSVVLGQGGVG